MSDIQWRTGPQTLEDEANMQQSKQSASSTQLQQYPPRIKVSTATHQKPENPHTIIIFCKITSVITTDLSVYKWILILHMGVLFVVIVTILENVQALFHTSYLVQSVGIPYIMLTLSWPSLLTLGPVLNVFFLICKKHYIIKLIK